MSLPTLRGHGDVVALLGRAAVSGSLPQSILLQGPAGVGKERIGLWLAQLLVCESPGEAAPCGSCLPCKLAERLEHPDVHWFFPLPRPDASSPEKLREKLEELRGAELQKRRENPLHIPSYERAPAHFLASVLTQQKLAGVRPAMGSRKVFVVGDAELMVPQESSPEAANAFLKLLEEPPSNTTLILTSALPGALLPTIRSRVLPVRVGPLAEEEVRAFLVDNGAADAQAGAQIAAFSQGSIGRALRLVPSGDTPGPLESQRQAGRDLLLAALSEGGSARLAAAHARPPAGARGEFLSEVEALSGWLRDLLAVASGAEDEVVNVDGVDMLRRAVDRLHIHPLSVTHALEYAGAAREQALGNVNPQLIVAELLRGIQSHLRPARSH